MALEIHNLQPNVPIDMELLKKVVETAADEVEPDISVSIVDDRAIHEVNRDHLEHDYATDVIAFDYTDSGNRGPLCGEIIVSAQTAARVASEKKHDRIAELVLYIIHGILHLRGYDDVTPEGAREMWRLQKTIMKELGYPGDFNP